MTRTLILVAASAALLLGVPLGAHHRFADTYLEAREITIEGDVVRWEYGDPHSFLHVVIRNDRNEPERWIVECLGARRLRHQGVTPETIKPGQRLILTGSPGRIAADHRLRLRAIVRPQDGWKWRDAVN